MAQICIGRSGARVEKGAALYLLICLLLNPLSGTYAQGLATSPTQGNGIIRLVEGQTLPVDTSALRNALPRAQRRKAQFILKSSNEAVLVVVGSSARAIKAAPEPVVLTILTRIGRTERVSHSYQIMVNEDPSTAVTSITFNFVPANAAVTPDSSLVITAIPRNAQGEVVNKSVIWGMADSDYADYVDVVSGTNRMAVIGKRDSVLRPSRLMFTARVGNFTEKDYVNLTSAPTPQQAPQSLSIDGHVYGAGGTGLQDVEVSLHVASTETTSDALNERRVVKTNEHGEFTFGNLKHNLPYMIELARDGYTFSPPTQQVTLAERSLIANFAALPVPPPDPVTQIVKTKLDPVDFRTVTYLYGSVANKQYSVGQLQISNTLAALRDGRFVGDSIVVYSDSIKVPVNYEVRYVGPKRSGGVDKSWRQWLPLDIMAANLDLHPDMSHPIDSSRRRSRPPQIEGETRDFACTQEPVYIAPYTLEQMLSSANRRESREPRSLIATAANGVATLTGGLSGVLLGPNTSNDTPLLLNMFTSLLIPSFKELFPSNRDANQQNLSRDVIHASETVPFKQSVQKMVFFPKEPWRIGRFEYRISHICQEPIKIQAVVARPGDQLPIHTLGGVVKDSAGRPVAGATVKLSGLFGEPQQVTTSSNGVFRFSRLEPGSYSLTAENGCQVSPQAQSVQLSGNSSNEVLTLPSTYVVKGVVKDKNSGSAMKNVKVTLKSDSLSKEATTDEKGEFTFPCLLEGGYTLTVTPPTNFELDSTSPVSLELPKDHRTNTQIFVKPKPAVSGDGSGGQDVLNEHSAPPPPGLGGNMARSDVTMLGDAQHGRSVGGLSLRPEPARVASGPHPQRRGTRRNRFR